MTSLGSLVVLACFLNAQLLNPVHSRQCFYNPTWPPTNPSLLRDPRTGLYDVRINPLVTTVSLRKNTMREFVYSLRKRYRGPKLRGSLTYLAARMMWSMKRKDAWDYYPQPVNHFRILKEVRKGLPVYEAPRHDPPLNIVRLPKTCRHRRWKYSFVLLIQSCVQCAKARQHSRHSYLRSSLWRGLKVGYAFVLGKPAKRRVKVFHVGGITIRQPPSYPRGTNPTRLWHQLLAESRRYRDMLIGDFEDGMFSYTRNYILAIRWASIFCNKKSPLFALVDGRYTVFPANFMRWLKKTPRRQKLRMYGGYVLNRRVNRHKGSAGQVSRQEYPHTYYPVLVNAGFILLGHDTVQDSAIMTAYKKYLRNVGGYVVTVNRMIRIHPRRIPGVYVVVRGRRNARKALAAMAASADRYINWRNGRVR